MRLPPVSSAQVGLLRSSTALASSLRPCLMCVGRRAYAEQAQTPPKGVNIFRNRSQNLPIRRVADKLRMDVTLPIKPSSKASLNNTETVAKKETRNETKKERKARLALRRREDEIAKAKADGLRPVISSKRSARTWQEERAQKQETQGKVKVALMARALGGAPATPAPAPSSGLSGVPTGAASPSPSASPASPPKEPDPEGTQAQISDSSISESPEVSTEAGAEEPEFGTKASLLREGKIPWIEDPKPWKPTPLTKAQRERLAVNQNPEKLEAARLKRQLAKTKRWEEVSKLRLQLVEDRAAALMGIEGIDEDFVEARAERLAVATEAAEALDLEDETLDQGFSEVEASVSHDPEFEEIPEHLTMPDEEVAPRMRAKKTRIPVMKDSIFSKKIVIHEVPPLRDAPVATLGRGLQRVLFNPAIHYLSDPRTSVFNFEQNLAHIPAVDEFAYDRCPQYITASKDPELLEMSEQHGTKYFGSTSTLTKALSQIYFAISGGKPVSFTNLSQDFSEGRTDFTAGAKLPASLIVKLLPGGKYAVDNDKRFDVDENVLSDMGRVLEKMLTTEDADFKRFLKSSPDSAVSAEERNAREAYRYSKVSKMLMRSQLDCHDPRLPGTGTFDIKTRACLPIRHDRANYLTNSEYDISRTHGFEKSYEREYYDLIRSGMLKYSLQARIGNMDGIFVAYHNTKRMFGFQYLPLEELDARLFGSTEMGDAAFKLSVVIIESILEQATAAYPETSINLTIDDTSFGADRRVTAWASPETWDKAAHAEQPITAFIVEFVSSLNGNPIMGHVTFPEDPAAREGADWNIKYEITRTPPSPEGERTARNGLNGANRRLISMQTLSVPEGKTVEEMYARDKLRSKIEATEAEAATPPLSSQELAEVVKASEEQEFASVKWRKADDRIHALRIAALESGKEYREREERIARERGAPRPPLPSAHYTSQQAVEAAARIAGSK